MEQLARAVLETPGDADPELRRTVEAYTASLDGRAGAAAEPPAELIPFLDKVAKHAYTVTDADVDGLRELGYSEDAIFELTLAAALGAARVRLELGLGAMRTDR